MIENYLVTLGQTKTRFDKLHSPVTVRRHYNMLNQLFNMANRERLMNDNPCRLVCRSVLKGLPTWQNRERWLNKYAADEEERLFDAFNRYGEHLVAITRIVLNTGIRPPKEVLAIKKVHINLSDEARYCRVEKTDVLIPPNAVLVAKGKDGKPRVLPLNRTAQDVNRHVIPGRNRRLAAKTSYQVLSECVKKILLTYFDSGILSTVHRHTHGIGIVELTTPISALALFV